jgi:hypothetical protein
MFRMSGIDAGRPDPMASLRVIHGQRGRKMHKVAVILCVMSVSLAAQWPDHPAPGLPRTAAGKIDLTAPAPRSAGGKPDLSGLWKTSRSFLLDAAPDVKTEDMLPWAAALYKKSGENYRNDTDGINCLPPGPKASISNGGGYPMKIIQTPNLIAVLYEYQTLFRQIFMDGRALPEDPNPTWMGYSIGRWDGDTLVVTTAGYNDRTSLDLGGHPHSESLRLTERFHRRDFGHVDYEVTIEDPKAYKRSWTLPIGLELVTEGDLIEFVCENERDKQHMIGKRDEEVSIPANVLAKYVGRYDSPVYPTGIIVTMEGDRLVIDPGGAGRVPLFAQSETRFSMEGNIVEFVKDAKGEVTGVVQHWTEGDRVAVRRK